jgi:uncharacterized membrane protein YecN with MAPEG domain
MGMFSRVQSFGLFYTWYCYLLVSLSLLLILKNSPYPLSFIVLYSIDSKNIPRAIVSRGQQQQSLLFQLLSLGQVFSVTKYIFLCGRVKHFKSSYAHSSKKRWYFPLEIVWFTFWFLGRVCFT